MGKPWEAFKTVAIVFSFAVNFIFVMVLLFAGAWLFDVKTAIVGPLVGSLHTGFVEMDDAHIRTTIRVSDTLQVNDTIPVVFDLPVQTDTVVVLTQNTRVPNTTVFLNGAPIPTDIVLPAGTRLGIKLDITVPVSQTVPVVLTVPVHLTVPVDIALKDTDLHQPFARLERTVGPYNTLLNTLPSTWDDAFCKYVSVCIPAP
ncbi:MAG: hypothetical protein HY260_21410 [Chloroflexi bacterium]|nr:hypothetical protein [Chloroflexota bacterium]